MIHGIKNWKITRDHLNMSTTHCIEYISDSPSTQKLGLFKKYIPYEWGHLILPDQLHPMSITCQYSHTDDHFICVATYVVTDMYAVNFTSKDVVLCDRNYVELNPYEGSEKHIEWCRRCVNEW